MVGGSASSATLRAVVRAAGGRAMAVPQWLHPHVSSPPLPAETVATSAAMSCRRGRGPHVTQRALPDHSGSARYMPTHRLPFPSHNGSTRPIACRRSWAPHCLRAARRRENRYPRTTEHENEAKAEPARGHRSGVREGVLCGRRSGAHRVRRRLGFPLSGAGATVRGRPTDLQEPAASADTGCQTTGGMPGCEASGTREPAIAGYTGVKDR